MRPLQRRTRGHSQHVPGQGGEEKWQLPRPNALPPRARKRRRDSVGSGRVRVTFATFARRCAADGSTQVVVCFILRMSSSGHRDHEGGINGKLHPVLKRQAVANDLDAPRIVDRHIDVHGCKRDIARRLPGTHAGDGAFEGQCSGGAAPRAQRKGACASGAGAGDSSMDDRQALHPGEAAANGSVMRGAKKACQMLHVFVC
ncbi:hypothetical protein AK812_SmicGene25862 [Symbiodinium microadriaticum]|uniref:Uncharacterized protein n=1 Tax=Symbiodinium microadriaticum TaxID=2951 RepID=A0A1Q9DB56_SYMMI|nr:hypothetical protein AK812_SmicGene25862 [Symbiodinium microadriaticum]